MKVLMINSVCGIRSTGRICTDLAIALEEQGHEVKIAYGRESVPEKFQKYAVRIGSDWDVKLHGVKARLFDASGFGSKQATKRFIKWVKEFDPDVIHLHNIHGYYINIEILFNYLKVCGKRIIWTLHDCWAFTGHCAYFDYVGCDRWKTQCKSCVQKSEYPSCSGVSRAKRNYITKKEIFTNIPDMTLVTPSDWLAGLVKQSFLKDYQVVTIHNGVDISVFRPTESDIASRYGLEGKKIVLGVAAVWDRRKGLDYIVQLADMLDDPYVVVVIGVTEAQKQKLPKNVLGLLRTNSVQELVEWYSAATVYVNPTLEDNYPTTNIESIACGTPVISFDTGGSGESAIIYGKIVDKQFDKIYTAVKKNQFVKKCSDISNERAVVRYINQYTRIDK